MCVDSKAGGVISKSTAESFVWRDVCLGWTLLDTARLHVIQERMPPATFELRHVHDRTHQLYVVLEGSATVDRDEERFELTKGEALEIPPRVPHQMRNDSSDDLEFLVLSSGRPREDRRNLE
jgi:mannose-6-phosphate isomerase-like protein (cupin superfamily)